ncbi:hypothetical protein Cs7R123_45550 [Catellatospora sp. TT07R-123]|uniref:sensor histidine kinase n=1 Tax=Catellatospora sp. TT07R-123 TaxID=2733863 RepID=UPI001B0406F0|nr:sensor histidine kinase [Catellatospora sp. TT07R-123]GHJ47213.1 hypothetical protein Cs7R123_45550 [Catellatospora sp. TT07R-123]
MNPNPQLIAPAIASRPRFSLSPASATALRWIALALYPVVLFETVQDGFRNPFGVPYLGSLLPLLTVALPAVLLRRRPVAALALMLLGATVLPFLGNDQWAAPYLRDVSNLQYLGIDLTVAYLAATRSRRVSVTAAAVTLVLQVLITAGSPQRSPDLANATLLLVLGMAAAWMGGYVVLERRRHTAAARVQASHQAVTDERLRIARELHDMVAHSIGIIAIQAGVGRRVIDTQPAEARNALAAIEDTSRDTLAGLRRMLGALRQADTGPAPLDPAPGLADLDRLAAVTADAGVRVDVRRTGSDRPLPPDLDLSAYRLIQEAVTNVVRHAGTDTCTVLVEQRDGELLLEIADEGRGGVVGPTGFGIAGMRERVALLHGELAAGPRPGGGFVVRARLPLPGPYGPQASS